MLRERQALEQRVAALEREMQRNTAMPAAAVAAKD
jgi:hypothetical protein